MSTKRIRACLASLMTLLLVLLSISPALAAAPVPSDDQAIEMVRSYGIVRGDNNGNLHLDETITRAEVAAIMVRAMGAEEVSKYFTQSEFTDLDRVPWAVGYVTMANKLGVMKGRGNGTFDPNSNITNAEVYAVLLRLAQREPAGAWDPVGIMGAAVQAGIGPDGPSDLMANLPAYRGAIFKSLAKALTVVPLSDGRNALYKYLDKTPPSLSVDALPSSTGSDTVTVAGIAQGASSVMVNGAAATLSGNRFTANVKLAVGSNNFAVVAKDLAENVSTQNLSITRGGSAASIQVAGPSSLKPGDSVTIKATAYDSSNRALPADVVTAKVDGGVGTYDLSTGVFKAGSTVGKGSITFTAGSVSKTVEIVVGTVSSAAKGLRIVSINDGNLVGLRKTATVKVQVVDDNGDPVPADYGRSVILAVTGLSGVTITPLAATTVNGVATFSITSTEAGDANLAANSSNLTSDSMDVNFGTGTRVVLSANPTSARADGTAIVRIQATLENESGQAVTNSTDSDIRVTLSTDSSRSASVSDRYLTIQKGTSASSWFEGSLVAGNRSETVKVTGEITSSHNYTVVPVSVSFSQSNVGSGTRFTLLGGTRTYDPTSSGNGEVNLTLRVEDNNGYLVTKDSYAFQIEVSTSNHEPLKDGLPEGLHLMLGRDSALVPVKGATNEVVGRTSDGTAELTLSYDKSGDVTLKIVGVAATDKARDDAGDSASAISGRGLSAETRTVHYAAVGGPTKLLIKADLAGGNVKDQPIGVLSSTSSSNTMRLKVRAVDEADGWITNFNRIVTLTKRSGKGTRLTSNPTARLANGVAEFTIAAEKDEATVDEWEATAGDLSGKFTVVTYKERPQDAPRVLSMHGKNSDDGHVGPDDPYLQIDMAPLSTYGYVKVLRGGSTVYTSEVMDLSKSGLNVQVPKSALSTTTSDYKITINNGVGDSLFSSDAWTVVNETPLDTNISKVRFSAPEATDKDQLDRLIVTASGLSSSGVVHPDKLYLRIGTDSTTKYLDELGATCTVSSGSFTCKFPTGQLSSDNYSGRVYLLTGAGWYTYEARGQSAKVDDTISDNVISPMAALTGASIVVTRDSNGKITGGTVSLTGINFNDGRIYPGKLTLGTNLALGTSSSNVSPSSSTSASISLSATLASQVDALGPASLTAANGWLKSSSNSDLNLAATVARVYAKSPLTSVNFKPSDGTLIFTGKGFAGGQVDLSKLRITTISGTPTLRLSGTVTPSNDSTFTVQLSESDAKWVTDNKNLGLYVVSDSVSTSSSWFTYENTWPSEAVTLRALGWR